MPKSKTAKEKDVRKKIAHPISLQIKENVPRSICMVMAGPTGSIEGLKIDLAFSTTTGSVILSIGERQFVLEAEPFIQAVYDQVVKEKVPSEREN